MRTSESVCMGVVIVSCIWPRPAISRRLRSKFSAIGQIADYERLSYMGLRLGAQHRSNRSGRSDAGLCANGMARRPEDRTESKKGDVAKWVVPAGEQVPCCARPAQPAARRSWLLAVDQQSSYPASSANAAACPPNRQRSGASAAGASRASSIAGVTDAVIACDQDWARPRSGQRRRGSVGGGRRLRPAC
jgi:hypothetical protein